jgi:DNA polymerase
MPTQDKPTQLEEVKNAVVNLEASALVDYRKEYSYLPVLGEGNYDADILFIGEAPGESEAKSGRPFCGRSGKMLDELLEHIALDRADVYITNILKDRPPENRDPTTDEIELYTPFLEAQIEIIQPKVIATLGRFAMEFIAQEYGVELNGTITQVCGRTYEIEAGVGNLTFVPLLHPAVALYDGSKRDVLKKDFEVLKKYTK